MSDLDFSIRRWSDYVTRNAELIDLRLRDIRGQLINPSPRLPLGITSLVKPTMARNRQAVVYHTTYKFAVHDADQHDIVDIGLTMTAVFKLANDLQFSEPMLRAFGELAVLDILHPYVRENVHALTGRMGIPPLILELKAPLYKRTAEGSEWPEDDDHGEL